MRKDDKGRIMCEMKSCTTKGTLYKMETIHKDKLYFCGPHFVHMANTITEANKRAQEKAEQKTSQDSCIGPDANSR